MAVSEIRDRRIVVTDVDAGRRNGGRVQRACVVGPPG
jgi:hypothetical protein